MARGRPINQKIRRPDCPLGHEGHTVLNGHYASPDKRFERPRFVCVPKDKLIPRHQFTAPLQPRHVVDANGDHSECAVCERPLHRSEGHVTPHYFRYAVHDLTLLLDKLSNGKSYRAAALEVRAAIGRTAKRGRIKGVVGDTASPALHAVDIFGPIVAAEGAPTRWPRVVIIDTIPLKRRRWKKRSRWNRRPAPGAPKPAGPHQDMASLRFRVEYALWDGQRYQDAVDDARQYGASTLLNWLLRNQQTAREQEETRAGLGRVDRNTAVVERLLATVWSRIEKRHHYYQNADRLNPLLDLVVAEIDGGGGVQRFSRVLRTHLRPATAS